MLGINGARDSVRRPRASDSLSLANKVERLFFRASSIVSRTLNVSRDSRCPLASTPCAFTFPPDNTAVTTSRIGNKSFNVLSCMPAEDSTFVDRTLVINYFLSFCTNQWMQLFCHAGYA